MAHITRPPYLIHPAPEIGAGSSKSNNTGRANPSATPASKGSQQDITVLLNGQAQDTSSAERFGSIAAAPSTGLLTSLAAPGTDKPKGETTGVVDGIITAVRRAEPRVMINERVEGLGQGLVASSEPQELPRERRPPAAVPRRGVLRCPAEFFAYKKQKQIKGFDPIHSIPPPQRAMPSSEPNEKTDASASDSGPSAPNAASAAAGANVDTGAAGLPGAAAATAAATQGSAAAPRSAPAAQGQCAYTACRRASCWFRAPPRLARPLGPRRPPWR